MIKGLCGPPQTPESCRSDQNTPAHTKVSKATRGDCDVRSSGVKVFEPTLRARKVGYDVFNQGRLTWRDICRAGTSVGWCSHGAEALRSTGFCSLCSSLLQLAGFK